MCSERKVWQVNKPYTVIRVGALNRIAIYWVPLIFLFFGLDEFGLLSSTSVEFKQGMVYVLLTIFCVLGCELFFFGFRVEFNAEELIYRSRGLPLPKTKEILRSQIRRARYEANFRADNKPWRFVEVSFSEPGGEQIMRINLTGFSSRDTEKLLQWLPNLER
jgi:hypothetical protein